MLIEKRAKEEKMSPAQVILGSSVTTNDRDMPKFNTELEDGKGRSWQTTPTEGELAQFLAHISMWEKLKVSALASSLDRQSEELVAA